MRLVEGVYFFRGCLWQSQKKLRAEEISNSVMIGPDQAESRPATCYTAKLRWYHLSRQKLAKFERELSRKDHPLTNDQSDRPKPAFCSPKTDDIAHDYKT
jgi:hypothetical protein